MRRKVSSILALVLGLVALSLPACGRIHAEDKEHGSQDEHKIVVTTPIAQDVIFTQPYVCQIRARRSIEVCALTDGYLAEVHVKEGQAVHKGEEMFKILPTLYKAKFEAEKARANLAHIKWSVSYTI